MCAAGSTLSWCGPYQYHRTTWEFPSGHWIWRKKRLITYFYTFLSLPPGLASFFCLTECGYRLDERSIVWIGRFFYLFSEYLDWDQPVSLDNGIYAVFVDYGCLLLSICYLVPIARTLHGLFILITSKSFRIFSRSLLYLNKKQKRSIWKKIESLYGNIWKWQGIYQVWLLLYRIAKPDIWVQHLDYIVLKMLAFPQNWFLWPLLATNMWLLDSTFFCPAYSNAFEKYKISPDALCSGFPAFKPYSHLLVFPLQETQLW